MGDEEFYEAAVRHWIDGTILEQQEEYDNAVCMQILKIPSFRMPFKQYFWN